MEDGDWGGEILAYASGVVRTHGDFQEQAWIQ